MPASAPVTPPDTGASISVMPFAASSLPSAAVPVAPAELMSMTMPPFAMPSAMPPLPNTASRTFCPLGSMVMTYIAAFRRVGGAVGGVNADLLRALQQQGAIEVEAADAIAALDQIVRHRPAHIAEADEAEARLGVAHFFTDGVTAGWAAGGSRPSFWNSSTMVLRAVPASGAPR